MRWFYWVDHHILRVWWHNFEEVAPGVYRSNQPDGKRLAQYRAMGVRSVLNLRGESLTPFYAITQEGCAEAKLKLYTVNKLSAHRAPDRDALLEVFKVFDEAERDLLIHCKSGADRTGLISALYLIDKCGESTRQARRHLSFKYLHIGWSTSGVLDMFLDDFARVEGQISLREWVANDYSSQDLAARGGRL
ncbi:MAG: tyrosine-protein phosphatase [Rhodobacteraceae bacterium]|nr:tyrosine-protein phosphatase [Paracoccaceae bacterium]